MNFIQPDLKLTGTPNSFPAFWNDENDIVNFYQMGPEVFRTSAFLGPAELYKRPFLGTAAIGDLLTVGSWQTTDSGTRHYIFHVAYCCSTLLARYLEQCREHLVLKEPGLLSLFATKYHHKSQSDYCRLVAILWLLKRRYQWQDTVFIKSNVPVNTIASQILAIDSAATASFIVHDLDACIVSILKFQWRIDKVREWNKNLYYKSLQTNRPIMKPHFLDNIRTAAFWWMENMKLAIDFVGTHPTRAILLTANDIAQRPIEVLTHLTGLPGLEYLRDRINPMVTSDVGRQYSKRDDREYGPKEREHELTSLLASYSDDVRETRQWISEQYGDAAAIAHHVVRSAALIA